MNLAVGAEPAAPKFPGGHRGRAPPVPIPNTEVKPATADGTACVGAWESRSLPGLFLGPPGPDCLTAVLVPSPLVERRSGLFLCTRPFTSLFWPPKRGH